MAVRSETRTGSRRRNASRGGFSLLRAARQGPVRTNEVTGVAVGIFLQVILMLGLGFPERPYRGQFGDDLAGPQAGCIDIGDGVLRDPLLLLAGVEDRRAIARPAVIALAVQRRGIVDLEEEFQDLAETDDPGIEDDLDRFGVIAVVAIGGVRHLAAGITD